MTGGEFATNDELAFLLDLGRSKRSTVPRGALLRSYLDAAAKRTHWGAINSATVISEANRMLVRAQRKESER